MFRFKSGKNFISGPWMIPILCTSSILIIVLLSLIASFAVMGLENPRDGIDIAALITLIISGAVSGFSSDKLRGNLKESVIILGAVDIVIIAFSLVCGNLPSGIMNALCYSGAGILSSLLSKSTGSRKRHRR